MSLTCIACKLLFSVSELHHEHYKSDWHRYNLKRRIAELPSVTKEEYEERAAAFEATNKQKEKISLRCESCNKNFSSQNAMSSHRKSKKHLEVEAALKSRPISPIKTKKSFENETDQKSQTTGKVLNDTETNDCDCSDEGADDGSDWESCDSEEEDFETVTVDTNDCLFCDHQSDSTEHNVAHMTEVHSFFIPDVEYVSDLDGLIGYLAGKLHIAHVCLWCNGKGKGFKSVKSVKQHMLDLGHSKILFEGDALADYADFYDYSSKADVEDNFDDEVIADLLQDSDFELVLPSGATIGHRSLANYYKQNLKPVTYDNQRKVNKVLQHYKALGYLGATGPAAVKKARDIVFMQRVKSRYHMKLGVKNNRLQPHFRSQIMF